MNHHPIDPIGVVVLPPIHGLTCSICAPCSLTRVEVEMATGWLATPRYGPWKAIDKSKPPNACEAYPNRQHWLLISPITNNVAK
jgi:hypothetical protein